MSKQLTDATWKSRTEAVLAIPDELVATSDKYRFLSAIDALAAGCTVTEISRNNGMTMGEIAYVCEVCPQARSVFQIARRIRDFQRQMQREDAAHERAVTGTTKTVYDNRGNVIATEQVTSDDLLKFLMKASEPEKFSDKVQVQGDSGVVLQVNLGLRSPEPVQTIEVTDVREQRIREPAQQPALPDGCESGDPRPARPAGDPVPRADAPCASADAPGSGQKPEAEGGQGQAPQACQGPA